MAQFVRWFHELTKDDTTVAGGKGANLGEMTRAGLPVPPGFVLTAAAYRAFIDEAGLQAEIDRQIAQVDVDNSASLEGAAQSIQSRIRAAEMPATVRAELLDAYQALSKQAGTTAERVAVRSSATMEDTKAASFAGMNRSYLNVRGADQLVRQVREVWASLYSPRVIYYRRRMALPGEPEIAVIVQKMVNAATSGVAFSINPATGDENTIVIEAAFGLGEVVVGGEVEPDHYEVAKQDLSIKSVRIGHKAFMLTQDENGDTVRINLPPERADARVLTDDQVRAVADLVRRDEHHYGAAQDVEWAFEDSRLFLVQSRPVTSRPQPRPAPAAADRGARTELVRGLGAGPGRASGRVRIVRSVAEGKALQPGEILVAPMTSPDWVPLMRRAAAIVTESGGMTSHAAIVSRELGAPCVVGARGAMERLQDGMLVTVDATLGVVLAGADEGRASATPGPAPALGMAGAPSAPARLVTATQLMVNLGEPEMAHDVAAQPVDGVGLLRAEFMLLSAFEGVHPRRLIADGRADDLATRMAEQVRVFAQAFYPRPVIYRSTDFRTNEFRGLAGGEEYEPHEENPMIGVRGAYRYTRDPELFRCEMTALKRVRETFPNLHLMIPFVRTGREFRVCRDMVEQSGLLGQRDFQLWVMAEVPSIVYWLDDYARAGLHGVSIGSNDLTQLVLGVDRDNDALAPLFDERDPAVVATIGAIIAACRRLGLHSSICGQAPTVYPEYAELLVRLGIDSISVNPDAVDRTRYNIAAAEQRVLLEGFRGHASTQTASAPTPDSGC
jgi:pyruvate,water dikinase